MPKRLSIAAMEQLESELATLLARIDAGDLEASSATKNRLQGAVTALSVALGKSPRDSLGLPPP